MLAAVEWTMNAADINVERNKYRKNKHNPGSQYGSAASVQPKQQVEQNQPKEQGRTRQPEANHEHDYEDDNCLNYMEARSVHFVELALHDALAET